MFALVAAGLVRRTLPGSPLTWMDLVDQIVMEHRVDKEELLWGSRAHAVAAARRHLWGALLGAGYTYETIAHAFSVKPIAVYRAVYRAVRELPARAA